MPSSALYLYHSSNIHASRPCAPNAPAPVSDALRKRGSVKRRRGGNAIKEKKMSRPGLFQPTTAAIAPIVLSVLATEASWLPASSLAQGTLRACMRWKIERRTLEASVCACWLSTSRQAGAGEAGSTDPGRRRAIGQTSNDVPGLLAATHSTAQSVCRVGCFVMASQSRAAVSYRIPAWYGQHDSLGNPVLILSRRVPSKRPISPRPGSLEGQSRVRVWTRQDEKQQHQDSMIMCHRRSPSSPRGDRIDLREVGTGSSECDSRCSCGSPNVSIRSVGRRKSAFALSWRCRSGPERSPDCRFRRPLTCLPVGLPTTSQPACRQAPRSRALPARFRL
ncbi:hypothetical protein GGR52DRAFT_497209 [Hypoxylon sp. FL1284]|nr:hypothetical protein GGR52DRAFT_497209 [Hypoxylon sp. FL1284]